jgi:IclR family transcriptional regulator, KDG regulon repressor
MSIETPAAQSRYFVEAVDRALHLLQTVAEEADLGVSEIARRSGDSKARAFRLLHTLEARGFLTRSEDGVGYRLGVAALALGTSAAEHLDIVRLSRPMLAELGTKAGETIQLRVRDGRESICVAKWEPGRDIQVNAVIGRRRPLHVGSSKVLLAYLDEDEREAFLRGPLERFTKNTIVDPKKLRLRFEQIKRAGMSVSRGEVNDDLVSITAPVFDASGRIAASLNLAAPAHRAPESRQEKIGEMVKDAARRISLAIGFRG